MKNKKIILLLFALAMFGLYFSYTECGDADMAKDYQKGKIAQIDGKNYVIVSNSEFVEILEMSKDGKLSQASEVRGMEAVKDLGVMKISDKPYLIVLTGRYLMKYDISNPYMPTIILKRDLLVKNSGNYDIGYMDSMSVNANYIFTAGAKGVRRFMPDNLFVDRIFYFEKASGVEAGSKYLAVTTPRQGLVFDIEVGNLVKSVALENVDNTVRKPTIGMDGNIYFPSDNSIVKINTHDSSSNEYVNPVKPGVTYSYAADFASESDVFYANGYGVTKLDKFLNKEKFLYAANPNVFGSNSWTTYLDATTTPCGLRIALFNKSSVILADENLRVLDQYRYAPLSIDSFLKPTELSLRIDNNVGVASDKVLATVYGFWPNEIISIGFYDAVDRYPVKADNMGSARVTIIVPEGLKGMKSISAIGDRSGLSYQTTFEVK
jgi:hypothetical protein